MSGCCPIGTYECQQLVICDNEQQRILSLDRCLIPEVQSLWVRGITTVGCCCGHMRADPYIQVNQFDSEAMRRLGYRQLEPRMDDDGFLCGLDCFEPKTTLPIKECS